MEPAENRVVKPLPKNGLSMEEIKQHLDDISLDDRFGKMLRGFRATEDVQRAGEEAYNKFMSDNGFFSLYMPYMRDIEQEVIAMGVSLLHPGETSTGNFTSGGTESNFSAIHAARDWAKDKFPHINKPNIVAPATIHPSFQKSCQYLQMEVITTDIDERGCGIPDKIAEAINDNTIMLAASAPSWHFSNIDPITEIAAIAEQNGSWMHVDACVGGYISPFLEKLGQHLPPWDFRVPGVMSISADLHKYGYCPKPASTIYWREAWMQDYHYVAIEDRFLGTYKLAGFSGSRSAGPIFGAWATMTYLGEEGYLDMTRRILEAKEKITNGVNAIEGLKMWEVDVMPLHFQSEKAPTGAIYQGLADKGWQMLGLVDPEAITVTLDPSMTDEDLDLFLATLREVTEGILAGDPAKKGQIRYG